MHHHQFVRLLYQEGTLQHSPETGRWTWDMERVLAAAHTDNVLDTVLANVGKLSDHVRRTLQVASCWGQTFTARQVASCGTIGSATSAELAMLNAEQVHSGCWAHAGASHTVVLYVHVLVLVGAGWHAGTHAPSLFERRLGNAARRVWRRHPVRLFA